MRLATFVVSVYLMLQAITGWAQFTSLSSYGENCNLKSPPASSVKAHSHAGEWAYFPAAPGATYTGCHWAWLGEEPVWVAVFDKGMLILVRSFGIVDNATTQCRYSNKAVVERTVQPVSSSGDKCPDADLFNDFLTMKPQ